LISALPPELRSKLADSMAGAEQVIAGLPAVVAADIRATVNAAFLDGLFVGSLVCAAIALGAAVVVAFMLPARARQISTATTRIEVNR
jgi:hypothetical protein